MYPILFEVGQTFISSLWVLVSIGVVVGGMVFIRLTQLSRLKVAFLVNNFLSVILCGLIGGRIVAIITSFDELLVNGRPFFLDVLGIWDRNFNFWGVVLGLGLSLAYFAKKEEESVKKWLDLLTLALLSAMPFGHLGSLLEGINYGHETSLPVGITFETFAVPYTLPIHPTQVYALIYTIIIATIAFLIFFKKIWPQEEGALTLIVAESYALLRFTEEFFRGDEYISFFGIHLAHIVSLLVAMGAGIFLFYRYNTRRT